MTTTLERVEAATAGQYVFEVTRTGYQVEEKVAEALQTKRIDLGTATMIRKQLHNKVSISEEKLRLLWDLQ